MTFRSLEKIIAQAVAAKAGNKEFALFRLGDGEWMAMIGNDCPSVMLGETGGEYSTHGGTPKDAVSKLIYGIKHG